jgi:hypothetical protein
MAHGLTSRDIQAGKENAWHRMTKIYQKITRKECMDYEVIPSKIHYKVPSGDPFGIEPDKLVEDPEWRRLIATDDNLPVGDPFGPSYCPTTIAGFWNLIEKGMGDTPYEVVSAGSTDNRAKIFATIKLTEGFRIKDREFKDYINFLDSFDRTCALTVCYSAICTVCANTFAANLQSGNVVGKAKHSALLESNLQRLVDAVDSFAGTSAYFKSLLAKADETPCSRDEAKAWVTGIETRSSKDLTNPIRQRTARITELFENGKGNQGRTRLDALQGLTEFYSHEASRSSDQQLYSSEWGSGSQVKRFVVEGFERDWDTFVQRGTRLLEKPEALLTA